MKCEDLKNWDEFEAALSRLDAERAETIKSSGLSVSRLLFRGQADTSWDLSTTLERRISEPLTLAQYFRLALTAKSQIETFTGQRWDIPNFPELREWASSYDNLSLKPFPGYAYLAYLRHHSFPSPLLDWTASPYAAAFFAFSKFSKGVANRDRVAIYVFQEYASGIKVGGSDVAQIVSLGPYVTTHSRHFLQQSQYTICCRFSDDKWSYAPHSEVFSAGLETQDRLWKYTLPSQEAARVLKQLDSYNLNSFSLFQTEEALLETIAFREIELRDREL